MGKKTRKKGGGGQNNVSLSGSIPTIEESLSQKNHTDEVGRMLCEHNRDYVRLYRLKK